MNEEKPKKRKKPEAKAPEKNALPRQQRRRAEIAAKKLATPTPAEEARWEMQRRRRARRLMNREQADGE